MKQKPSGADDISKLRSSNFNFILLIHIITIYMYNAYYVILLACMFAANLILFFHNTKIQNQYLFERPQFVLKPNGKSFIQLIQ